MSLRVYKRGKKYWYYFSINNKVFRNTTHTESKELALLYAQKIYNEAYLDNSNIKNLDVLISDFVEHHLKHKQNNVSKKWHKTKSRDLNHFLEFTQKRNLEYLQDINLVVLEEYKSILLSENKPKTAKNIMANISTMLSHAVRLDYLNKNPCIKIDPIRGIQKNKKRFLSNDEIMKVLKATEKTSIKDLVLTALYTGMRRGELVNLEWKDFDFEKRLVYVRNKNGFTTKSLKERVIPLNQKLYDAFQGNKSKKGYCFKMNADWVTEKFVDIAERIELIDVSLHTLRHTFASHLAMQGVPLFHIAQWLGHSTTHVTELYAHLCPQDPGRSEINRLNF